MTTLEHLQRMIGEAVVVDDNIWLYNEQMYLEEKFVAIVIGTFEDVNLHSRFGFDFAVSSWSAETAAVAKLFYPDGQVRSTWVVIGQQGFKDSLKVVE